jgi:hypothetical protein
MKHQKFIDKKGNKLLLSIVLLTAFNSCERFLEVDPPKTKIETSLVFKNERTADQAIIAIYATMSNTGAFASGDENSVSTLCGLSADELINYPRKMPEPQEFDENDLTALNANVFNLWTSLYKAIYLSNAALEGLDAAASINSNVKTVLKGEALFDRAFCYFYLVNLFGDVPLIISTDYAINAKAPRVAKDNVYKQIINDLLEAKALLNDDYNGAERIRPNKATAEGMLARVYLFTGDWGNAELYSTLVIDQTRYELTDLNKVFLANSLETIWQLKPGTQIDLVSGATHEASVFTPPMILNFNVLQSTLVTSFEPGDQRYVEWVRKYGTIYHPYKYRQNNVNNPLTEYSTVLRLSEQILIRAEARAQLDNLWGNNSAEADINRIRNRAGLGNTSAGTKDQLLSAIAQERRVELFTEWGHRWLDLKRTNQADLVLDPLKPKWSSIDALYPIPQKERNNNPNLKPQNPGY